MEKKDLESYVGWEYLQMFRPSQRTKIQNFIQSKNIWQYKDLCRLGEEEFKSFKFVDDNVYTKTAAHLAKYGLRFGMSEEEILEYMDADFLAEHPEEAVETKQEGTDKMVETEPELPHSPAAKSEYAFTENDLSLLPTELSIIIEDAFEKENVNDEPLPEWSEKEVRQSFSHEIDHAQSSYDYYESEWMRVHFIAEAYNKLPWHYHFMSNEKRTNAAMKVGELLFEKYKATWLDRLVAVEHEKFDKEYKAVKERNDHNAVLRQSIIDEKTKLYFSEHPVLADVHIDEIRPALGNPSAKFHDILFKGDAGSGEKPNDKNPT